MLDLHVGKANDTKHNMNLPEIDCSGHTTPLRNELSESLHLDVQTNDTEDCKSTDTSSKELEAGRYEIETIIGNEKSEKKESDCGEDDVSSTQSSIASDGTSEPDNPRKPPPRPPRPLKASTSSQPELTTDFKSRILGKQAGPPPRDLSKKGKPSGPEQVDFRGQLKKTGLRADKDLTTQGKRKQQLHEGDFHGQLKATSADTSRNLSALRNTGKKKEGPVQVDFRGNLNKTQDESTSRKIAPPRPPKTYSSKKSDGETLLSHSLPKSQTREASVSKETAEPAESSGNGARKISSTDLFNMLHKPVESSKEGYLVQRGIKKAEASKGSTQKFGKPSVDTSTEDEKFKARMAWRKERSDKQLLPGKGHNAERKMSAGVETKDFQAILKKAGVQQTRPSEISTDRDTKEQPSTSASKG